VGVQGLEWLILIIGMIAASVALVAVGIIFGKLGILTTVLLKHVGLTLSRLLTDLVRFVGGAIVALVLLPVALGRLVILRPGSALEALEASGHESVVALKSLGCAVALRPLELLGLSALVGHVGTRMRVALGDENEKRNSPAEFPGYTVLRDSAIDPYDFGPGLDDALAAYVRANSPVRVPTDGRIVTR
jgi:hypothetical protein